MYTHSVPFRAVHFLWSTHANNQMWINYCCIVQFVFYDNFWSEFTYRFFITLWSVVVFFDFLLWAAVGCGSVCNKKTIFIPQIIDEALRFVFISPLCHCLICVWDMLQQCAYLLIWLPSGWKKNYAFYCYKKKVGKNLTIFWAFSKCEIQR